MILNHISVGTADIHAAVKFYDTVLSALSIQRSHYSEQSEAAYGTAYEFWVVSVGDGKASAGNGTHIAFNASTREAVDQFYALAIEHGGRCEGKPGLRPEYGETYYAAFVRDLDGNKIEAVSM